MKDLGSLDIFSVSSLLDLIMKFYVSKYAPNVLHELKMTNCKSVRFSLDPSVKLLVNIEQF